MNLYRTFLIFSILLIPIIKISLSQISLGSYQLEKIIEVQNENFYVTKILFWNSGKKDIKLTLEIEETPKCLDVFLERKELILSEDISDNFEIIILNNKEVKAIPINIYFYTKSKECEGNVIIKVVSESLEKPEISVKQERDFVFIVKKNREITEEKRSNYTQRNNFLSQINQIIENQKVNILPILIIFFSIAISIVIFIFKKHK